MKKLILIPIILFIFIALIFFRGLSTDPKKIPSSLMGKPIPNFAVPTLSHSKNINISKFKGKPYILNVFATWCEACQKEHALLLKIAKDQVILGLDYKDTPKTAQQFLDQLGNPYQAVFLDETGKIALDLGVYTTPETFLVDAQGIVRYRHSGPLTFDVWKQEFVPLLNRFKLEEANMREQPVIKSATHSTETLHLATELMKKPSITPNDFGCMPLLAKRLERFGFKSEIFRFEDVDNLWMKRGSKGPLFVFLGHTDVVPPGPLDAWKTNPFEPVVIENRLYGRGAVDMKGGIAAMVIAVERFLTAHPDFDGSIAFLLTSDEEGPSINGTRRAIDLLVNKRQEKIDWCLVGEPSSSKQVGDVIRKGRRGSLSGDLLIKGIQGHVAYPHKVKNPIHLSAPFIKTLTETVWDRGNENFPPTSLQIVHIQAGTGTYNVVPGNLEIKFNFRYSPEVTASSLQERIIHQLKSHNLLYEIHWSHSADPFLTPPGFLLEKTKEAVMEVMGFEPQFSTDGGTSDARFIAPLGIPVVELGLCNQTLHQVNECVAIDDLEHLSRIYERLLVLLFPLSS